MKSIWRVLGYMRKYWFLEALAYVGMLGINGIRLLTPQITRRIVDVGIAENNEQVLLTSVLLLALATLVQGVFRFGYGYFAQSVSQGIGYDMRNQIYRKLQSLSFSYHDKTQAGQLLSRTTSDVERLQNLAGRGLIMMTDTIVLSIGTLIIMLQMHVQLALLSLVIMPIIAILMRWFIRTIHKLFRRRQDEMGNLTALLEQNLLGTSVVRGFAQEDAERRRFSDQNDTIFDLSRRITKIGSFAMPMVVFLASVSTVLIVWLGGRMVIAGTLTIGTLIAFNSYVLQLAGPMRRLGMIANMVSESQASAERVFAVLDAKSDVTNAPNAKPIGEVQGHVEFDHVTFSYVSDVKVIDDVSFAVEPGQVVALLGPTGSGKTTVTNLIPRFYDISDGSIKIDGHDTRRITIESLREQIGIVLQETTLFGSTIKENITFGKPEATQEEIERAAKAAAAHDFIVGFAEGYDTEVGERGVTLSGGQRQRIAIARALLLNPRILILDDATSSVDTETETQIQGALENLMDGRTSFVIAQRVSTVRNADMILVMDDGKLVAQGKHSDLIRESGIYAEIYHRQLRSAASAEGERS